MYGILVIALNLELKIGLIAFQAEQSLYSFSIILSSDVNKAGQVTIVTNAWFAKAVSTVHVARHLNVIVLSFGAAITARLT